MEHAQLELNQALWKAVKEADVERVEVLLNQGADPLGSLDENDLVQCVLEELFYDASYDEEPDERKLQLLRLFLSYGMDIASGNDHDREKEDLNPVWSLAHVSSESGLHMLKILLDHGLDTISAEVLVSHIFVDMEMCDGCDTQDEWWMEQWAYSLKMVMLIASYPHVLETSPYIRKCVALEQNDVSWLPHFRDWNRFIYKIDLSTCDNVPHGLRNATLWIRDKVSGENVWTMLI